MRMNKLLGAILVGGIALVLSVGASEFTTTVSSTALKVLGTPSAEKAQAWVTGTAYVAGELTESNGRVYMCMGSGTSGATAPYGIVDISDGTVTWRPVLSRRREGLLITNNGTTDVTIVFDFGQVPTAGQGLVLGSDDGIVLSGTGCPQIAVKALTASGSTTLHCIEW